MPARRDFGSVRELPSGRFQATWKTAGESHKAPMTFRTKTDAKNYLSEVENQLAKGTYSDPKADFRTVRFVGGEWLASNPDKAKVTVARDTSILTQHVYPKMGERDIRNIDRNDIIKLVNGWRDETSSAETVRRQYTCMASMFNYAALNGWIPGSPCVKIPLPPKQPAKRHLLSPDEVVRLADAMGEGLSASVWIAAEVGIRWN